MTRVPPMKCIPHLIPECLECRARIAAKQKATGWQNPKPHGPVSEHLMRHWYGAKR